MIDVLIVVNRVAMLFRMVVDGEEGEIASFVES